MDTKKVKIAIAANGPTKEDLVADRFARAPYFIVYNQDDLSFSTIKNDGINASSGASVEAAKILLEHEIDVVLAPKLGDKAFAALNAMEIEAFEYSSEQTVRDVLYSFFEHQLPKIENASTKGLHKQ
jgi:predicted Fe-Mo cluster-binding NifX family protein